MESQRICLDPEEVPDTRVYSANFSNALANAIYGERDTGGSELEKATCHDQAKGPESSWAPAGVIDMLTGPQATHGELQVVSRHQNSQTELGSSDELSSRSGGIC